jgi:rubredoxin
MNNTNSIVKVNLPGGFISPGDLYEVLLIAETCGAAEVRLGNRQQLFFNVENDKLEDLEAGMLQIEMAYEVNADKYPNMISSYVSDHIFSQDGWLKEGVYKDIFDLFNYQPRLKVNVIDNNQTFVPFFSGHLNLIASDQHNYWYLYMRFPKRGDLYCYPFLVYSEDIPLVCKAAEELMLQNNIAVYAGSIVTEDLFFELLAAKSNVYTQQLTSSLKLPDFYLPYYEGFNQYGNQRYWLGIYRRDEVFKVSLLKDVCAVCLNQRIGQLYTTPWKSLLIKGIERKGREEWTGLLNIHRLNIRHASNELNWQIEDLCEEGLEIKKQVVRDFEEADLRTYKLTFAIKTQPQTGLTASIIIKKQADNGYEIIYTHDFNPNSREYVTYLKNVNQQQLSKRLIALCEEYYRIKGNCPVLGVISWQETKPLSTQPEVYQCPHCLTKYDKRYGDPMNNVDKDVDFKKLASYQCPVCEAPGSEFVLCG